MKPKQQKNGSLSVLIVLLVAIVLVVSLTFAWIVSKDVSLTRLFSVSNLYAQSLLWFDDGDGTTTVPANGKVTAGWANEDNKIYDLHACVKYNGAGVGLIRVHVIEEWYKTVDGKRYVQQYDLKLPYTVSSQYNSGNSGTNQSAWYDNRDVDRCFYYAIPVSSTGTSSIDLFSGVGTMDTGSTDGLKVDIIVEADVVQVNRYPQYWDMNALPWRSGDPFMYAPTTGLAATP